MEDNPDLLAGFIIETLTGLEEADSGHLEAYQP